MAGGRVIGYVKVGGQLLGTRWLKRACEGGGWVQVSSLGGINKNSWLLREYWLSSLTCLNGEILRY